jgi:hypothetical protein
MEIGKLYKKVMSGCVMWNYILSDDRIVYVVEDDASFDIKIATKWLMFSEDGEGVQCVDVSSLVGDEALLFNLIKRRVLNEYNNAKKMIESLEYAAQLFSDRG